MLTDEIGSEALAGAADPADRVRRVADDQLVVEHGVDELTEIGAELVVHALGLGEDRRRGVLGDGVAESVPDQFVVEQDLLDLPQRHGVIFSRKLEGDHPPQ